MLNDKTLIDVLMNRAQHTPDDLLYAFLDNGETISQTLSYRELEQRARAIAAKIQQTSDQGDRVLLVYPPGIEFICAFFACLYAGLIAVPVYPPAGQKTWPRFLNIIEDCEANIVCVSDSFNETITERLGKNTNNNSDAQRKHLSIVKTKQISTITHTDFCAPPLSSQQIAYLQYTSGTTADPKGVVITHHNLMSNLAFSESAFETSSKSCLVGWLPFYHDMGLVANILQGLYSGFPSYLMPASAFMRRPLRWLQAIARFGATHSGGPNFAYDLCVQRIDDNDINELDLSSWQCAFSGAERVRAATVERFNNKVVHTGFQLKAFKPSYGMAEATLFVSSGSHRHEIRSLTVDTEQLKNNRIVLATDAASSETIISCGNSQHHQIVILESTTNQPCDPNQIGEIAVSGDNIAHQYWNKDSRVNADLNVSIAGSDARFYRTGDLGFMHDGELYITGRSKEMIIVRGKNYYPQDIELVVQSCDTACRPGAGAAFSIDVDGEEKLIVLQEILRKHENRVDLAELEINARLALAQTLSIGLFQLIPIKQSSCPITSSGKIRRLEAKRLYREKQLETVFENP